MFVSHLEKNVSVFVPLVSTTSLVSSLARIVPAFFPGSLTSSTRNMRHLAAFFFILSLLATGSGAVDYFIMVRPSSEVAEGQAVQFHCEPGLNSPLPPGGYRILRGGQVVHAQNTVGNPYKLTASRLDDGVVFKCGFDDGSQSDNSVALRVDYGPTKVSVTSRRFVANGRRPLNITCHTDVVKPSPSISWKVVSRKRQTIRDFDGGPVTSGPGGTWFATLTLTPDPEEHGEVVTCTVENEKYPKIRVSNSSTLSFVYPPRLTFAPDTKVTMGTRIQIGCGPTESGRPDVKYSLYRGDTLLTSLEHVTYNLTTSRDDDKAKFKCSAPDDLDSTTRAITVLYPPAERPEIDFSYNYSLIAGGSRTITCSIAGGNPLANITWECDKVTPTHDVTRKGGVAESRMTVIGPHGTSSLKCTCRGSHVTGLYNESASFTFTVYYGPDSVQIEGNKRTRANGKKTLNLKCVTSSANPAPTFTWLNASADDVISVGTERTREENGWSSTLTFRPNRYQDGNVIVCDVTNPIIPDFDKISANVTLDLIYPPLKGPVIETPDGTVAYAGRETHAICSVEGGKPLADVTWSCDNMTSPVVISDVSNVARVQLIPPYNVTSVSCRCQARHTMKAYSGSEDVEFQVFYPPGKPTIEFQNLTIVAGQELKVKCQVSSVGYPAAEFTVYKNDKSVQKVTSPDEWVSLGDADTGDHSAEFVCEAANNYTRSYPPSPRSDPLNLTVYGKVDFCSSWSDWK